MPDVVFKSTDLDIWLKGRIAAAGQDPSVVKDEPLRLLKMKDVMERTQLGRSTIYRQIAAGKFPKPIHLIN